MDTKKLNMDTKKFKSMIGELAPTYGFKSAFGAWYQESVDTIVQLSAMKSNFGPFCYLTINVFPKGFYGQQYTVNKVLMRIDSIIGIRPQMPYIEALKLDNSMSDEARVQLLRECFSSLLVPFTQIALNRLTLINAIKEGEFGLKCHPSTLIELERLNNAH